jgi:signal transduction histidine kinase/predicted RNA-binding protein with RPS1 domain/ActR/RegA family two-component response regulator
MPEQTRERFRIGQVLNVTVKEVFPFGVFVEADDGTQAYIRQRELTLARTVDPRAVVAEGDRFAAAVVALPEKSQKLELSLRETEEDHWEAFARENGPQGIVRGSVKRLARRGVWVEITPGVDGWVTLSELAPWPVVQPERLLWIGDPVEATITHISPEKKHLSLSIRRRLMHMARAHAVSGHLQGASDLVNTAEDVATAETPAVDQDFDSSLELGGRAIVLDDYAGVREELYKWLRRHGIQADAFGNLEEALESISNNDLRLAIIDLDVDGKSGLDFIRALRHVRPETRVFVMSIPEWVAQHASKLEELAVDYVLTKPLVMDDLRDALERLAHGDEVGPFRMASPEGGADSVSSVPELAEAMKSGMSLDERLALAVERLVHQSGAELGILFHYEAASKRVQVVARAGNLVWTPEAAYGLADSPVKDVILHGSELYVTQMTRHLEGRFRKLLDVVAFQSCVGVPVPAGGKVQHALMIFHRRQDAFSKYRLRDACAAATLLSVALESDALNQSLREANPFLLTGQLSAAFAHDVSNKMSAMELLARNLKSSCSDIVRSLDRGLPPGDLDGRPVVEDMDELLAKALDLRETVEAFRSIVQADDEDETEVNSIVTRAVKLLLPVARTERVQITTALADDLPPVVASSVRLQQVFLNIMLNAIQHMGLKMAQWQDGPRGWKRLLVSTGVQPGPPETVWVRFEDMGPGIHRQLWDKIFDLGFSTRPQGTGLGLFIARSLTESMGGRVMVESSLIPFGTTFRVDLRVSPPVGSEGPTPKPEPPVRS